MRQWLLLLVLLLVLMPGGSAGAAAQPPVPALGPAAQAPAGYRLPFDGTFRITQGPSCPQYSHSRIPEALDIKMPVGTPIVAMAAGEVIFAGVSGNYGNLIQVRHDDGNISFYAHQSAFHRTSGRVAQGELIGASGHLHGGGLSDFPHLHLHVQSPAGLTVKISDLPGIAWDSPGYFCLGSATGPTITRGCQSGPASSLLPSDQPTPSGASEMDASAAPGQELGPTHLGVFVRAVDNTIFQRTYSGGWGTWTGIGAPPGGATSDPAAVAAAPGQIDVFVRGSDNALWQTTFSAGVWGPWIGRGGYLTSGPDVASWGPGNLDVFVCGDDSAIHHRSYSPASGWSAWATLGSPPGGATSDPSAVSWGIGRTDLFVRGADRGLWQRSLANGVWGPWTPLGGVLIGSPDAASWGAGHLDVYVRADDQTLAHRVYLNGGWSPWEKLGGVLTASPGAVSPGPGQISVFVRGVNQVLWHRAYRNGAWGAWEGLDGVLTSSPDAASWSIR